MARVVDPVTGLGGWEEVTDGMEEPPMSAGRPMGALEWRRSRLVADPRAMTPGMEEPARRMPSSAGLALIGGGRLTSAGRAWLGRFRPSIILTASLRRSATPCRGSSPCTHSQSTRSTPRRRLGRSLRTAGSAAQRQALRAAGRQWVKIEEPQAPWKSRPLRRSPCGFARQRARVDGSSFLTHLRASRNPRLTPLRSGAVHRRALVVGWKCRASTTSKASCRRSATP